MRDNNVSATIRYERMWEDSPTHKQKSIFQIGCFYFMFSVFVFLFLKEYSKVQNIIIYL